MMEAMIRTKGNPKKEEAIHLSDECLHIYDPILQQVKELRIK